MIDVSCICPTYSRPQLLEESIESFLRQDFGGTAELIILNDCEDQDLRLSHPRVRVVNACTRFDSLGAKYNFGFDMARGKYITPWEDDDIILPHKISHAVEALERDNLEYYKLPWAYLWQYGNIETLTSNVFWVCGMWTKDLVTRCRGCERVNSPADQSIEAKMLGEAAGHTIATPAHLEDIYYVYRWGGVGTHLSGLGGDDETALARAQEIIDGNRKRTGKIQLEPHYDKDYEAQAMAYLQQNGEKHADICSDS